MRDYSARLPGFCVKPCSHAFSTGPPAMKCCAGCWGGPSSSRSPHPLSSGRGSIFRARMRRHHARARQAAGLRRKPPRIVRKSRVRPKQIRTQIYDKNGHFLRGLSALYRGNAPFSATVFDEENACFFSLIVSKITVPMGFLVQGGAKTDRCMQLGMGEKTRPVVAAG
jgi:hypothetical protein